MVAAIVMLSPIVGGASAFAANQSRAQAAAQWQQAIAELPTPGAGCYQASYPALQWQATRCRVAPKWPLAPGQQTGSGGPQAVGNGRDYSAKVTGTISSATGSFDDVSPKITETGQVDDEGSQVANTFSLQLNSEFFSTSACSGASKPAGCLGWQQFVYTTHPNEVFMQYWLVHYDTTCPGGWYTHKSGSIVDCYTNSPASKATGLTASDLAKVKLIGQAVVGGNDRVSLSIGSGQATAVSKSDSVLNLAQVWNTTEFGVFGDGSGGQANFGTKSTLEVQTQLTATSPSAPKCIEEGFTAETNNLDLTSTPALGTEASPTMASEETNQGMKSRSCAAAAGETPSIVGNWTDDIDWTNGDYKGVVGSFGVTFSKGGTFTDSTGEYGKWTQSGSELKFVYDTAINGGCGASYSGKWENQSGEWKGQMTSDCSTPDSSGTWHMVAGRGAGRKSAHARGPGNPRA